jgi:SAM-dependent methyltransferase
MENFKFNELTKGIKVGNCKTCKNEDCKGYLAYDNLCANVKYLIEYAEQNFDKNQETFIALRKIMGEQNPSIFSFGCGLGLDYLGAIESFGERVIYHPIDECEWAIKDTDNFKNFEPKLPRRTMKYDEAIFMLRITTQNPVLCFFNSLFTISDHTNLINDLLEILKNKGKFYFVCNYTINNNFHLPSTEQDFIDNLLKKLRPSFAFKKFDILDGKGIIIAGERK